MRHRMDLFGVEKVDEDLSEEQRSLMLRVRVPKHIESKCPERRDWAKGAFVIACSWMDHATMAVHVPNPRSVECVFAG